MIILNKMIIYCSSLINIFLLISYLNKKASVNIKNYSQVNNWLHTVDELKLLILSNWSFELKFWKEPNRNWTFVSMCVFFFSIWLFPKSSHKLLIITQLVMQCIWHFLIQPKLWIMHIARGTLTVLFDPVAIVP